MDRVMFELATFHEINLRDQIIAHEGHWFHQCYVHKYKNLVQSLRNMEDTEDDEGFSVARLIRVAKKLETTAETSEQQKMFGAVKLALLGKTDALSQAR